MLKTIEILMHFKSARHALNWKSHMKLNDSLMKGSTIESENLAQFYYSIDCSLFFNKNTQHETLTLNLQN